MNPQEPAFPVDGTHIMGLTKREFIAIQLMAGLLSNVGNHTTEAVFIYAAHKAVCFTDALMAELSKPQRKE